MIISPVQNRDLRIIRVCTHHTDTGSLIINQKRSLFNANQILMEHQKTNS